MIHRILLFMTSFLLVSAAAWASDDGTLFLAARDAYKNRNEKALASYAATLSADRYVLAPYVEYWRLLLRLETADDQEVRDFITHYADLPFSERVRVEWLKKLGRRGDWLTFFQESGHGALEDTAVSCYNAYFIFNFVSDSSTEALRQVRPLWFSGTPQPENCDPVFDLMIQTGVLTSEDLWARFRMALDAGKPSVAKSVLQRLNFADAANLKLFDKVYENPQRALEKKTINVKNRFGRELGLYALERVSRNLPDTALGLWDTAQHGYSKEEQAYLWGRMALHAARRLDPVALDWFARAGDTPLNAEQQAWKARAALRVRNWNALLDTIAAMSPTLQEEAAWRYWRARALKEKGRIAEANALWVPLSRERSFYGLLANEDLGETLTAPAANYKASEDEIRAMQQLPGVARAMELHKLELQWEARNEWAWAMRDKNDKQLLAAAEAAFRAEWYDVAINTADKTRLEHDFSLRYPTPYRDKMQAYARENGLDEAWVYGLIRQESRFISTAKSGVGASGLMQIMPATAKWIAKRLGVSDYRHATINELETNIQFGTHYLRYTLDQMGGQPVVATAAYNAGPGRARRWANQTMEGAIYAETIPFNETRLYVQKVMSNAYYYSQRVGTRVMTLKQRLGQISGSGGGVPASDAEP